jgi:hypothetical protein
MRARSVACVAGVAWALLLPTAAAAQSFSGSYTMPAQQGGTITLTLRQAPDGRLTGSLRGTGAEFTVDGVVEGGTAMGAMANPQGGVFFEAVLDGTRLLLTLIEAGPGNMPDYDKARTLVLERAGTVPPAAAGPLGGPPPSQEAGTAGDLLGRWTCQTSEGTAQLAFLSPTELEYNGERLPYQRQGGVVRVPGDFGPVDYRVTVSGDQLQAVGPDGGTIQCRRQGATAGAQGVTGGLEERLQGQICAYSSSLDGGYSTLRKFYFDGQGRFLYGSESSFSGESGFAYGLQSNPNAGAYQVTGLQKGAEIHLRFPDGSSGTAYVFHGDGSRIYEISFNEQLYGASLCQ